MSLCDENGFLLLSQSLWSILSFLTDELKRCLLSHQGSKRKFIHSMPHPHSQHILGRSEHWSWEDAIWGPKTASIQESRSILHQRSKAWSWAFQSSTCTRQAERGFLDCGPQGWWVLTQRFSRQKETPNCAAKKDGDDSNCYYCSLLDLTKASREPIALLIAVQIWSMFTKWKLSIFI